MGLKKSKNTFKKILENHITKNGQKHKIEKIIIKSLKQTQKQQQKNTKNIIKISIMRISPAFRLIKLTNKRRRKKSIKQIPAFLSNNKFRSSWGLKNLIKKSTNEISNTTLDKELSNKFLLTAELKNKNIELKTNQQDEASKEKKYFRHYRW